MNCPDCRRLIQPTATACRCGWTAERARNAPVHCAHERCPLPAKCRVKTPTGWANLCEPHYVQFHDHQARLRCAGKGLLKRADETGDEYRKRMMAYIKGAAKLKRFDDAHPMSEADRVAELA